MDCLDWLDVFLVTDRCFIAGSAVGSIVGLLGTDLCFLLVFSGTRGRTFDCFDCLVGFLGTDLVSVALFPGIELGFLGGFSGTGGRPFDCLDEACFDFDLDFNGSHALLAWDLDFL